MRGPFRYFIIHIHNACIIHSYSFLRSLYIIKYTTTNTPVIAFLYGLETVPNHNTRLFSAKPPGHGDDGGQS